VAEVVVDVLEVVEVEEDEREVVPEALGAGDLGGEDLLESPAVRETGQRVDASLARLLLRPAKRAQQRACEDEGEEHQCRQRQQPRHRHPCGKWSWLI